MQYLSSFTLPSEETEAGFILSYPHQLEMTCYADNPYPFKIFPKKRLEKLEFEPLTMLYGGNGSGKSTLLNVIAQKLNLSRSAPFNNAPCFGDYLKFCRYGTVNDKTVPPESRIITSDDVFDFLLDARAINEGIDKRREELFDEYVQARYNDRGFTLKSLDDYEEVKRHNEAKRKSVTKSKYTSRRLPREMTGKSNGESALAYFTAKIGDNALYLLDEPENSLSVKLQTQLAGFIEDSVRFYGCQFIISTHSPFLLSMKDAKIYDLDSVPACQKKWSELENMREYHKLFKAHEKDFG